MDPPLTLVDLNDDCLLQIVQRVVSMHGWPTIGHLLNTCRRFRSLPIVDWIAAYYRTRILDPLCVPERYIPDPRLFPARFCHLAWIHSLSRCIPLVDNAFTNECLLNNKDLHSIHLELMMHHDGATLMVEAPLIYQLNDCNIPFTERPTSDIRKEVTMAPRAKFPYLDPSRVSQMNPLTGFTYQPFVMFLSQPLDPPHLNEWRFYIDSLGRTKMRCSVVSTQFSRLQVGDEFNVPVKAVVLCHPFLFFIPEFLFELKPERVVFANYSYRYNPPLRLAYNMADWLSNVKHVSIEYDRIFDDKLLACLPETLQELVVVSGKTFDLASLAHLRQLKVLSISLQKSIVIFPPNLAELFPHLESLFLTLPDLNKIPFHDLNCLPSLKRLALAPYAAGYSNNVAVPINLARMTRLETLEMLDVCSLPDDLSIATILDLKNQGMRLLQLLFRDLEPMPLLKHLSLVSRSAYADHFGVRRGTATNTLAPEYASIADKFPNLSYLRVEKYEWDFKDTQHEIADENALFSPFWLEAHRFTVAWSHRQY